MVVVVSGATVVVVSGAVVAGWVVSVVSIVESAGPVGEALASAVGSA